MRMDKTILALNEGWRFDLGECEDAWYKGYSIDHWKKVMIPHDWSVESPFSKEYSSGTGYLSGGIGWYRLRFQLPEMYRGKRIRLVFDGVYKNSQVWCNSYYLGKRPNGYISFSYDISDFVSFGKTDNGISVKVTHTDLADSRWFTGSGITRKVWLMIEEAVHPAEYGCVFKGEQVVHRIVNTTQKPVNVRVITEFYRKDGEKEARFEGMTQIKPDGEQELLLETKVENPFLWSPQNPYLYKMKSWYQVDEGEANLVDEQNIGFRHIVFDAEKGFFLNGIATKIKGVCVHHDGGCLGAAMKSEVWQRRLSLLKECGCNAIRCSHNPHMPELYDLCDQMGFLVMDEAFDEWENAKNKWSTGHNVYPPKHQGYYEDFHQWHEADLRAMVQRDRNHPSVIMWSIGNEIDYPNDPYCHPLFETMTGNNDANKPEAERRYDSNKPNANRLLPIAKQLVDIVREEDNTRPITLAAAFPELSSRIGLFDVLDVVGYNYKEHLYVDDHQRFPTIPLLGSENSHSYQAWRAVKDNDYISGQFLWTGIDYLGEAKGWPIHGSQAGIMTTAGFAKPEFDERKTFWCNENAIYIVTQKDDESVNRWSSMSKSWNYEADEKVCVKCYATLNQEDVYVELSRNGKVVGKSERSKEDGAFTFSVNFEAGTLSALMCTKEGEILAQSSLITTNTAKNMHIQLYKEDDFLTGKSWQEVSREVGYIYQVIVELQDDKGQWVVWDDRMVSVQVHGAGEFAGMDNGNLADVTPFSVQQRKTFNGKLVVYIRRVEKGNINIFIQDTNAQSHEIKILE